MMLGLGPRTWVIHIYEALGTYLRSQMLQFFFGVFDLEIQNGHPNKNIVIYLVLEQLGE